MPIWKKEFFEDGEIWKENAESRRLFEHNVSEPFIEEMTSAQKKN